MHVDELIPKIEDAIRAIWPDAFLQVSFSAGIYPGIDVHFAIGKDKTEWSNGIIHNDPGHHRFTIGGVDRYGITNAGDIEGKIELTRPLGGGVMDKDYSTQKVGFRKKTVVPEKVMTLIPTLETYFKRLKTKYDEMVSADTVKVPVSARLRAIVSQVTRAMMESDLREILDEVVETNIGSRSIWFNSKEVLLTMYDRAVVLEVDGEDLGMYSMKDWYYSDEWDTEHMAKDMAEVIDKSGKVGQLTFSESRERGQGLEWVLS